METAVNFSQLKLDQDLLFGGKQTHFNKCYKIKSRARGFNTLVNRIALDITREIEKITFEEEIQKFKEEKNKAKFPQLYETGNVDKK